MSEFASSCPVNGVKADETVVRIIAAQVAFLTTISVVAVTPELTLLLAIDFGLRAFGAARFSISRSVAKGIKRSLNVKGKMTDEAPKRFAAGIGFAIMVFLAAAQFLDWSGTGFLLGAVIVLFATLEAGFAFCVGCVVYKWLGRLKLFPQR